MADRVVPAAKLLAGRYRVGELIGRGGMADVRVGTDTRLGRKVAIKVLKPTLASNPAFRTRFRREAQDAAKMAHTSIVRIFDAGEETLTTASGKETRVPFIVMEYVEGKLLKDLIAEGPMPAAKAGRIIGEVLTALEYSHRAGVVHRDIKPGNIMISTAGDVKVMDFGIARAISESSATIAETSAIVGTAQYFSPEQAKGDNVDARTDLYSTGVVLFELLTGTPPFRGENPVAVAYQHVNQQPVAPSSLNQAVPSTLDAVVLRALSKDRATRYQSATEFREDIEAAVSGNPTAVRQPSPTQEFSAALLGAGQESFTAPQAALRQLAVGQDSRVSGTQSRPPVSWIWAGIVLMVAIIAGLIFWTANLPKNPLANSLSVSVPNVVGEQFEAAVTELEGAKLKAQEFKVFDEELAIGIVVKTFPDAGANVAPGQLVKVYVSNGPRSVAVPSVAGLTVEAATKAIQDAGLDVGTVSNSNSPNIAKGVVITSDPGSGSSLVGGDLVNLTVSTGLVDVPSVVGKSSAEAGGTLSSLQLIVYVIPNVSCTGGTVLNQSLTPGARPQKSEITIEVCSG